MANQQNQTTMIGVTPKVGDMVSWRCPKCKTVRKTVWLDGTGANFGNKTCYAHGEPVGLTIVEVNDQSA